MSDAAEIRNMSDLQFETVLAGFCLIGTVVPQAVALRFSKHPDSLETSFSNPRALGFSCLAWGAFIVLVMLSPAGHIGHDFGPGVLVLLSTIPGLVVHAGLAVVLVRLARWHHQRRKTGRSLGPATTALGWLAFVASGTAAMFGTLIVLFN